MLEIELTNMARVTAAAAAAAEAAAAAVAVAKFDSPISKLPSTAIDFIVPPTATYLVAG